MNHRYFFIAIIFCLFVNCKQTAKVVSVYKDEIKESQNFFTDKWILKKQDLFNSEGKKVNSLDFFYTKNKFDSITFKGEVLVFDKEGFDKYFDDIEVKLNILRKRKIIVPYAFLNGSEVSDIANVFSVSDNFDEKKIDGYRVIIFNNLNENIRFYPSDIERFIPQNSLVYKYELTLKNDFVMKEVFDFTDGKLIRIYDYNERKLIKIESIASYKDDNELYKSSKVFRFSS